MESPTRGIVFCAHVSPLLDSEGLQDKKCPAFPYILLRARHTIFSLPHFHLSHSHWISYPVSDCVLCSLPFNTFKKPKQIKMLMSSLEVKQENKVQKVHQTKGVSKKAGAVRLSLEGSGNPFLRTHSVVRLALALCSGPQVLEVRVQLIPCAPNPAASRFRWNQEEIYA